MSKRARLGIWFFLIIAIFIIAVIIRMATHDPFATVIDHYHHLHEPITPADFETPAPPDDQNASLAILSAEAALRLSDADENRFFGTLSLSDPLSSDDLTRAAQIVSDNSAAFDEALRAANLPQMRWPGPVVDPTDPAAPPRRGPSHFNQTRHLANILRLAAIVHHHQGDDPTALLYVRAILRLAEIAGHDGPFVAHLVDNGIVALGCETLKTIAPTLHIDPSSRPIAVATIAALLDDEARKAAIIRSWQVERAWSQESLHLQFRSPISRLAMGSAPTIIANSDDRACAAALQPNWPPAKAYFARTKPPAPSRHSIGQNLAAVLNPSLERGILTDFRILAERRLTATMLAIRLYRADHGNALPNSLADLAPKYLPKIPADPFAADGSPIRYHRDPAPILYSVNEDAVDNDGNATPKKIEDEWSAPDYVIPLSPTAASTSRPAAN